MWTLCRCIFQFSGFEYTWMITSPDLLSLVRGACCAFTDFTAAGVTQRADAHPLLQILAQLGQLVAERVIGGLPLFLALGFEHLPPWRSVSGKSNPH